MALDLARIRADYARDGVVFLPQVLNAAEMKDALAAFEWSLANPGPAASNIPQLSKDAVFYQDLNNNASLPAYIPMLERSPWAELLPRVWGSQDVWFMYEQVFLKKGGESRRTPWHQDTSYLTINGPDIAVAWISFDPVAKEDSLEFVKGSHKGPLFNGSSFALEDDTAPLHPGADMPRLPDIEADRTKFEIVSFATKPGDVVLFHPSILHGGAPTHPGLQRRTLTLRFFGENAIFEQRGGSAFPVIPGFHDRVKHGDPFRDPAFFKLPQPRRAA